MLKTVKVLLIAGMMGFSSYACGKDPAIIELKIPPKPLTQSLRWQHEPNGPGEFLFQPDPLLMSRPESHTTIADREFCATSLGLLTKKGPEPWTIVPATYGLNLKIAGSHDGQLMLSTAGKSLFSLDPTNLAIHLQLKNIQGYVINIERDGFWVMDNFPEDSHTQRAWGGREIAHYSTDGTELTRYKLGEHNIPPGVISETHFDRDALWLIVRPNTWSYSGPCTWIRIDRSTALITVARSNAVWTAVYLPDQILYTEYPDKLNSNDRVMSIDKKTMKVIPIPTRIPPCSVIVENGIYIWVIPQPDKATGKTASPIALSLPDLKPIPDAKLLPSSLMDSANLAVGQFAHVLAADLDIAWILQGSTALLELHDEESALQRKIASASSANYASVNEATGLARGKNLFRVIDNAIVEVSAGGEILRRRDLATTDETVKILGVGREDIWVFVSGPKPRCIRLKYDLSDNTTQIDAQPMRPDIVGDDDAFSLGHGEIWHINHATTKWETLPSFDRQFTQAQRRDLTLVRKLIRLPDGKLLFMPPDVSPSHVDFGTFIYDPAADVWQTAKDRIFAAKLLIAGKTLYALVFDLDAPQQADGVLPLKYLYAWDGVAWKVASETLPAPIRLGVHYEYDAWLDAVSTSRFLYMNTPLGIYRVQWTSMTK
jgi:hypothetical protein